MPSFTDTLKVNGQDMEMYASLPSGPGPHPAVVIAFHIGGIDEFDKAMADPHCGDCTNQPAPCIRCLLEDCVEEAIWHDEQD